MAIELVIKHVLVNIFLRDSEDKFKLCYVLPKPNVISLDKPYCEQSSLNVRYFLFGVIPRYNLVMPKL